MDKPIFLPLIKKYVETIDNKEAERRFTKLAKDYTDAMNEGCDYIMSNRVVKGALEKLTSDTANPVISETDHFKSIVDEFEYKAQELASEYIKDPKVLEAIHQAAVEDVQNDIPLMSEKEQIAIRIRDRRTSTSNGLDY